MLNFLAKFILTGTSFAPFFAAFSIKEFENGNSLVAGLLFLSIAIVLVCSCWTMLNYTTRKAEIFSVSYSEYTVERRDYESLVFLLVCLLPIILSDSNPFTSQPITTIFCLIAVTVAISYSHAFHYNPVVRLFGYRFYTLKNKADPSILLISKFELPSSNKNLQMVCIAKDVIIEYGER